MKFILAAALMGTLAALPSAGCNAPQPDTPHSSPNSNRETSASSAQDNSAQLNVFDEGQAYGNALSTNPLRSKDEACTAESYAEQHSLGYALGDAMKVCGISQTSRSLLDVSTVPIVGVAASPGGRHGRIGTAGVDCDQLQIECFRGCWRRKPPWPIDKGKRGHYMYCSKKCLAEYMLCIGEKAAERAFNTMAEAVKWLREHPEVVVGTIILVAGVAYMVATTGTGGMVLVLL